MQLKTSRYLLTDHAPQTADQATAKRLLFSTRKGMGLTVSNYLLQLILNETYTDIPDHIFNILLFHEMIVPADEDETTEVILRKQLGAEDEALAQETLVFAGNQSAEVWRTQLHDTFPSSGKHYQLVLESQDYTTLISMMTVIRDHQQELALGTFSVTMSCVFEDNLDLSRLSLEDADDLHLHILLPLTHSSGASDLEKMFKAIKATDTVTMRKDVHIIISSADIASLAVWKPVIQALITAPHTQVRCHLNLQESDIPNLVDIERELIRTLSAAELYLDLLGRGGFTSLPADRSWQSEVHQTPGLYLQKSLANQHYPVPASSFRSIPFTSAMTEELRGASPCHACTCLPLCGGRPGKSTQHMQDCPAFVTNLMEKVQLKYKMTF